MSCGTSCLLIHTVGELHSPENKNKQQQHITYKWGREVIMHLEFCDNNFKVFFFYFAVVDVYSFIFP